MSQDEASANPTIPARARSVSSSRRDDAVRSRRTASSAVDPTATGTTKAATTSGIEVAPSGTPRSEAVVSSVANDAMPRAGVTATFTESAPSSAGR